MNIPRVKDIREKLGFTQAEFSNFLKQEKNLKISRGTIAKYESGVNFPSKTTLKKLSEALNVSEYYLSGEGPNIEDVDEKLIKLLHSQFFTEEFGGNPFHELMVNFLIYKGDKNKPESFYLNPDGVLNEYIGNTRFPLLETISEFWRKDFDFLFKDQEFKESLVGTTDEEFKQKTFDRIQKEYDKDLVNRNYLVLQEEVDNSYDRIRLQISKALHGTATDEDIHRVLKNGIDTLQNADKQLIRTKKG